MGKGKGRITGTKRKEINDRTVNEVMYGNTEETQFARVLKHLGAGQIRVILSNKHEGIAKIRTVLSRRGSTPIVADDVVIVSGRDFETKSTVGPDGRPVDKIERYDVLGVLTRAQAAKMEKDGRIPSWFLTTDTAAATGDTDIFDYSEVPDVNIDDDVDIDEI